jgi:signal transduction histidine kinase
VSRVDEKAGAAPATTAEARLRGMQERIISRWERAVRGEIAAAAGEEHLILVDTLPAVLDQLAEALSPRHPRRTATQGSTVALEHGGERVRLTQFRLEDLIAEYKLLRQIVFDLLEEDGPLSKRERDILNVSLDQAITEACTGYALVQATFKGHLFAIVAHDLRNPLGVAYNHARLIQLRPTSDETSEWAARIVENLARVDRMLQDLLDAMKLETGARMRLELEACDLVDIVRTSLEHVRDEVGQRLVIDAPTPVEGFFSPDALRRAVENLVSNALKYGSPTEPIVVTVRAVHGRAILTVHNEGPHIPADKQETLFRAFQRTSEAHTSGKEGWGLGLAQVRAAAEAHGGSIGVDSLPDRGTTFVIDIPADARPYQSVPITRST